MKRKNLVKLIIILLIIPLMALLLHLFSPEQVMVFSYLGEDFKVSAENPSYSKEQLDRIAELIKAMKLPKEIENYGAFIAFTDSVKPKAYGMSLSATETDIGRFAFYAFEVPNKGLFRVMVYFQENDQEKLRLFEEFYHPGRPPFNKFKISNDTLIYTDYTYEPVFRKTKLNLY